MLDARGDERYLLILVTADKGLCGAFNTNLIKAAQGFVAANPGKQIEILAVGRKGRDFFRRRGATLAGEYIGLTGKGRVEFSEALEVARDIIKCFTEDKEIDKAFVVYNEFKSVMQQRVVIEPRCVVSSERFEPRCTISICVPAIAKPFVRTPQRRIFQPSDFPIVDSRRPPGCIQRFAFLGWQCGLSTRGGEIFERGEANVDRVQRHRSERRVRGRLGNRHFRDGQDLNEGLLRSAQPLRERGHIGELTHAPARRRAQ